MGYTSIFARAPSYISLGGLEIQSRGTGPFTELLTATDNKLGRIL